MPVTKKGYWQIELDDVSVSGSSVASTKSAILDSGTSLLVGPTEDVKAIASQVVSWREVSFLLSHVACVWVEYRRVLEPG